MEEQKQRSKSNDDFVTIEHKESEEFSDEHVDTENKARVRKNSKFNILKLKYSTKLKDRMEKYKKSREDKRLHKLSLTQSTQETAPLTDSALETRFLRQIVREEKELQQIDEAMSEDMDINNSETFQEVRAETFQEEGAETFIDVKEISNGEEHL